MARGTVRLVVDSRDRENMSADTASCYTVRLDRVINDVLSVGVCRACFPRAPTVPMGRSSVWASDGLSGPPVEVRMPPGEHTPTTLASALADSLSSAIPALSWSASLTPYGCVSLSASGPFSVRGGDGSHPDGYGPASIARELGVPPHGALLSGPGNSVEFPHPVMLGQPQDLRLVIDCVQAARAPASALDCSAVVVCDGEDRSIDGFPAARLNPPSMVDRLRVRVIDWYGGLADMGNKEHRFELSFECIA